MTTVELPPTDVAEPTDPLVTGTLDDAEPGDAPEAVAPDAPRGDLPVFQTALAAACTMVAAGLLLGGVFRGVLPRIAATLAALLGVGLVAAAARYRRPWMQYLVLPAALLGGAVLVVPDANGRGSANLPGLVIEAIQAGGLNQPPIAFDPGWRFVLVVVCCTVAAAALGLALAFNRPRLAVLVPAPLIVAGEVVQPLGTAEVIVTVVVAVLVVLAMTAASSAQLHINGVLVSRQVEMQRLTRTLLLAPVLAGALVATSSLGFLFPQPDKHTVIPAQRPQPPPAIADTTLFTYHSPQKDPLRTGTIDVYDQVQQAWLLPPYDTSRLVDLPSSGEVPGAARAGAPGAYVTSITVVDSQGHGLPSTSTVTAIHGVNGRVQVDTRTGVLTYPDQRVYNGLSYQVYSPPPATGAQLEAAPRAPAAMAEFLQAPPVPPQVAALLADPAIPANSYDRLQALRKALLTNVVASGPGTPKDLPASRVPAMLVGGTATPYEITAAEALLARWAGVPSRIGYGYFGGDPRPDGSFEVHPRHGAAWLEAYFQGYGWIAIVGKPLHAEASTADTTKHHDSSILQSPTLALVVYVATQEKSPLQYFQLVQYWALVVLPWVVLLVLLVVFSPAIAKGVRLRRRRRWARGRPPRDRIVLAYAAFRDLAADLSYADPLATPLSYLALVEPDDEHEELAWLVTRTLWGDLQRELRTADAVRAEALSASLRARLRRPQAAGALLSAAISRRSLREPWTREVPNAWPTHRERARRQRLRARLPRRVAALIGGLLAVLMTGCGTADYQGPTTLSAGLTPPAVSTIRLVREKSAENAFLKASSSPLVSTGRVYTLQHDDIIEGSVQVSLLKPDVRADDPEVFAGLNQNVGSGTFQRVQVVADQPVWMKQLPDQRIYLWFPPRANAIEMVVLRNQFLPAKQLIAALVDFQHGRPMRSFPIPVPVAPTPPPGAEQFPTPTQGSPAIPVAPAPPSAASTPTPGAH